MCNNYVTRTGFISNPLKIPIPLTLYQVLHKTPFEIPTKSKRNHIFPCNFLSEDNGPHKELKNLVPLDLFYIERVYDNVAFTIMKHKQKMPSSS